MTLPSAMAMFALLEEVTPDLILLDIEMSGMDGFEALQQLKANELYTGIPVIFLTSRRDAVTEIRGFEMGVVDVVTKPFSPFVLRNRIRSHITYTLLRTTIDSLCDGILVTDLDGRLIMANSTATAMLGQELQAGEKPAFLAALPETSPFIQFQKSFDSQTGVVSISLGRKPVYYVVTPYKNAVKMVIGAVHILRRSM
jgi:CheY-like chemotaxis protein